VFVPKTGRRHELVIVDEDSMSPKELEQRRAALAAFKQHPRDSDANRHALARGNRCYEAFVGDRRTFVARCIAEFETVLDGQDPRAADHARVEFLKQLDTVEGETWL